MWYNTLATLTGAYVAAFNSFPQVRSYPQLMEEVKKKRLEQDEDIEPEHLYNPFLSNGEEVELDQADGVNIARAMNYAKEAWIPFYPKLKSDPIKDTINALFGTEGLYDFANNRDNNVHPMIQMVSIGRSILESGYRYFALSGASLAGGGLLNLIGQVQVGQALSLFSSISLKVALASIAVGMVLFYILPFMPFIYFFFAVAGWVKAIFEAMVGVPLWALAHLRIDGDGLAGDAAKNGYYLLLEIFLRPILVVFGLVAALSIFSAQVKVLHEIWQLVVENVTGYDETAATNSGLLENLRGEVDTFFYTVIYAIIVYMMAMASFKLIDLIPNHILRWMGVSVDTFGEQSGDPAEHLARNTMYGVNQVGGVMEQGQAQISATSQKLGNVLHRSGQTS